jgi:hypothetical protein
MTFKSTLQSCRAFFFMLKRTMKRKRVAVAHQHTDQFGKKRISRSSSFSSLIGVFRQTFGRREKPGKSVPESDDDEQLTQSIGPNNMESYDCGTPFCLAGPSSSSPKAYKNMLGEDVSVSPPGSGYPMPSLVQVEKFVTGEVEDDSMEPVFLPVDSPLKGKENAVWRKRQSHRSQFFLAPDERDRPRDTVLENGAGIEPIVSPRMPAKSYSATTLRFHPKKSGVDCSRDVIFRIPRVQSKEYR